MKHFLTTLILTLFFIQAKAQIDSAFFPVYSLISKPVPRYHAKTIAGKTIDSSYFRGKVTVLSFFSTGCAPCRYELSLLNEWEKILPKDSFQILMIVDANTEEVKALRAKNSAHYGKMKRKLGIDSLAFDLIADCPDLAYKFIHKGCVGSSTTFKINAWPTALFISKDGIIKHAMTGISIPRTKEDDLQFWEMLRETAGYPVRHISN